MQRILHKEERGIAPGGGGGAEGGGGGAEGGISSGVGESGDGNGEGGAGPSVVGTDDEDVASARQDPFYWGRGGGGGEHEPLHSLPSHRAKMLYRSAEKRGLPGHVTCSLFVPLCGLDQTQLVDLMLLAAHFLRKKYSL
jgi:hypothetical protein